MKCTLLIAGNFKQEEISDPILDITLEPGDMLYFPRGTIHQVITAVFIHHFWLWFVNIQGIQFTWYTFTAHNSVCCPEELLGRFAGKS